MFANLDNLIKHDYKVFSSTPLSFQFTPFETTTFTSTTSLTTIPSVDNDTAKIKAHGI